ncbi:MAG: PepSY domain-containing protein [Planctomycetes bacterium]|nr:PepSY domain-containing protein [Planctomycetota bacterium]
MPDRQVAATTKRTGARLRACALLVHRWVGLAIAVFLVVAGLSGSVLVFYHELDSALNPQLHRITASAPLDPLLLRLRVSEQLGDEVRQVDLGGGDGGPRVFWHAASAREVFVDPGSGTVLGSRHWGDLSEGTVNLMPFIYRLHYQLALGETGTLLFGIVALLWTIDCFVGLYLTLPPGRSASPDGRGWLSRWKPAWLMRAASLFGAVFTFHRAAGLWLWALLLVFAWSAVAFNLRPVYVAVTGAVLPMTDVWATLPGLDSPRATPRLDWPEALAAARAGMAGEAGRRGFRTIAEGGLSYEPAQGLYRYDVHSSLDLQRRWPGTRLWFDGDSGATVAFDAPTGVDGGGTLTSWLLALHMAAVGGLPYRLLVIALGLAVAALSVTGVAIWWRKRRRPSIHSDFPPRQPPPDQTTHGAPSATTANRSMST